MKVFIGDPCYVLSNENYWKILDHSYWCDDLDDGTLVHKGCLLNEDVEEEDVDEWLEKAYGIWDDYDRGFGDVYPVDEDGNPLDYVKVASTWIGDGCYEDQDGHSYWVDSGQLGMVPSHLWESDRREMDEETLNRLGRVVELDYDKFFLYDLKANGTLQLGPITIPTGPGDWEGNYVPDEDEDEE